ncbi:MAG: 50S ribosomal protein L5 [Candidatus Cloacimonadota bacterium]|nr:MAG: 50S ribosomal protein L5 [Candidatus Cloacimonadota bacterium]
MLVLEKKYKEEVVPALMKEFNYSNIMCVPKLEKMTINIGVGDAKDNKKLIESSAKELETITGQKVVVTKAKKSLSNFKIREGMAIGVKVTLRGNNMYHFLTKLISAALPRVRDFQGLSRKSCDGRGNYNLGIKEQLIFPEIEYDKIDKMRGMNITIGTSATTNDEAVALLEGLGMPFIKKQDGGK